ncbi:MAG: hypothetical protein M0R28_21100 [Pigmentiphaga sp.]|nr:hypothetical protein [Pigmentiphaga sp.]
MNRHVLDPEFAAFGVAAGAIITTTNIFTDLVAPRWIAPGLLTLFLLLLMTAEIFTCFLATPKPLRKSYEWEKHVGAKLLLISLVVVSAILDGIFLLVITYYPTGPAELPVWAEGFMPVMISTLIWLSTAEAGRAILHVAHGTDISNISPVVIWVIRQLRKVDMMRLPAGRQADERLIDRVTEEDITELLGKLKSREELEAPPPPLDTGVPPISANVPPVSDTPKKEDPT